jgi:hypothetical protein
MMSLWKRPGAIIHVYLSRRLANPSTMRGKVVDA